MKSECKQQQLPKQNKELERRDSLAQFFQLLLKIDRRVNPDLYTKKLNDK